MNKRLIALKGKWGNPFPAPRWIPFPREAATASNSEPPASLSLSLGHPLSVMDPDTDDDAQPQAGPSTLTPAPSPYHDSSQFLHWRFTPSNLHALRDALNVKSVEVVGRNSALEKVSLFSGFFIYP